MMGHLIRAELSPSDSIDLKLIARADASDALFIDIEYEGSDAAGAIARILERFIRDARSYKRVTVRLPCHDPALVGPALQSSQQLLHERPQLALPDLRLLVHVIGAPSVVWRWGDSGLSRMGRDAVTDERERELRALIGYYGALHSDSSVKFILPSGAEASSFLLTADVLQSQRDCQVLALWCFDEFAVRLPDKLQRSTISILVDTPGLLPLCYELWRLTEAVGSAPGRITVAPSYPHSGGEVDSLIRTSVASADVLLCIVSASVSGVMSSLFARGVERVLGSSRSAVIVLAALKNHGATRDDAVSFLSHLDVDSEADLRAATTTVRVEPSTMRFLPWEPTELGEAALPPTDKGTERWLQFVSRHRAVGLECLPHSRRDLVRPRSGLMAFRLLVDRLSVHGRRLAQVVDESDFAPMVNGGGRLVVVSPDDLDAAGGASKIADFLQALKIEVTKVIPIDELADDGGESPVLCFAWGSVTGQSAAELFRLATEACMRPVDLGLLYLRPPSPNDVKMLRSTVGGANLAVGWHVLVPWSSAFEPEALFLSDYLDSDPTIGEDLRSLALQRLNLISPIGADQDWEQRRSRLGEAAGRLLWCDDFVESDGWMSDTPALLLAAASELARRRSRGSPQFRLDLKASIESGSPPRWIAALIRQSFRGEIMYWSSSLDRSHEADFVTDWVLADRPERAQLLAELLCADALGKIPDDLIGRVVEGIEERQLSDTGEYAAALKLTLGMHRWSRGQLRHPKST